MRQRPDGKETLLPIISKIFVPQLSIIGLMQLVNNSPTNALPINRAIIFIFQRHLIQENNNSVTIKNTDDPGTIKKIKI